MYRPLDLIELNKMDAPIRADLHLHSNHSDSSRSLEEVFLMAKENGIHLVSITDHDRVDHWQVVEEYSEMYHILCLRGVEISAMDKETGKKVHILGYGFDGEGKTISELVSPTLEKRMQRSLRQLDILSTAGFSIDEKRVRELSAHSGVIYKQHIVQMLTEQGIADGINGSFYRRHFKGEGICSEDIEYVDWRDAVEAVHADGGLAVLAHPGESGLMKELSKYVSMIDGVERNHPTHTLEDRRMIDSLRMPVTGGSDDHGRYGPEGRTGGYLSPWVPVKGGFFRL